MTPGEATAIAVVVAIAVVLIGAAWTDAARRRDELDRVEQERRDADEWIRARGWEQVGALEFRRYRTFPEDGWRYELERVHFEDTPAGRLAAREFAHEHVRGPRIVHTRDHWGR